MSTNDRLVLTKPTKRRLLFLVSYIFLGIVYRISYCITITKYYYYYYFIIIIIIIASSIRVSIIIDRSDYYFIA